MALTTVDHSALKVNQAGIIVTVLVAFFGSWILAGNRLVLLLIPLLAVVLLLGTFAAQGLGGVFLAISSVLVFLPVDARTSVLTVGLGLAIALLVAALAFVNLAFGYCLGCQIYFQLGKRGLIRA